MLAFVCLFVFRKSAYLFGFYYDHIFSLGTKCFASMIASTVDVTPQKSVKIIRIHWMMLLCYSPNRDCVFGPLGFQGVGKR